MGESLRTRQSQRTAASATPAAAVTPGKSTNVPVYVDGIARAAAATAASLFTGKTPWASESQAQNPDASAAQQSSEGTQEDRVRARAITTGFAAAQHAVDVGAHVASATRHLEHVRNVAVDYQRTHDYDLVTHAADAFDDAIRRAENKLAKLPTSLLELNASTRRALRLHSASARSSVPAFGSELQYAKSAIGPALDVLTMDANETFAFVETQEHGAPRTSAVQRIGAEIANSATYVSSLLERLPKAERVVFRPSTELAAVAIGKLLRWSRTRTPHANLERSLLPGVGAFDEVLHLTGAPSIESRTATLLSEAAVHAGEQESAGVSHAAETLRAVLHGIGRRQTTAITAFYDLAKLEDTVQPDFKAELLKALVAAVIGNVTTAITQALSHPSRPRLPMAAKTIGLPSAHPGQRDSVAKILNVGLTSLQQAINATTAPSNVDPKQRALVFFRAAMQNGADKKLELYSANIQTLAAASEVSADELTDLSARFRATTELVFHEYLTRASIAWASYLSRSRLGEERAGSEKVSTMEQYFGKPVAGGREFGTSKSGGDGVLSVHLRLNGANGKPEIDHSLTKIVGLNGELKATILQAAEHRLGKVSLPKEVHVDVRFAHATIALDEQNRIRDVSNWGDVERYVGVSAYSFWKQWVRDLEVR
jgi:hypothetical protein